MALVLARLRPDPLADRSRSTASRSRASPPTSTSAISFGHRSFLERAAKGDLPAVSWIDPNFYDLTFGPTGSNDDHPPSDLRAGQKLVLQLVDALMQSPAWKKTLLVITYDEHGGFFDHVQPPKAADDRPAMRRYGPRVPAIVVSPFVGAQSVSKTVFDHTSIIKTILTRFCAKKDGSIPKMGARVAAAKHLASCSPSSRRERSSAASTSHCWTRRRSGTRRWCTPASPSKEPARWPCRTS